MKTVLLAATLFSLTATGVAFYPAQKAKPPVSPSGGSPLGDAFTQERRKIEVVFVLDTTGSMGGLIQAAKEKIWSIASTLASANHAPEIRMGLVAYRDRGDDYVTQVIDLSADLDSMYAKLMDFQANGGGDGPESVNQALHDAVNRISWSQDANSYKVVFLVGDAPPHMDYQDDVKYPATLAQAKSRGIIVNSIQCGQQSDTQHDWQQIAQLGQGRYLEVGQSGSALAITTPYDADIARASKELDDTRLYYGTANERKKQSAKVAATDKLHATGSVESRARRAAFNSSASGRDNFLGEQELVEAVASGKVDLPSLKPELLPATMQAMSPQEQKAEIVAKSAKREELQGEVQRLSKAREDYLAKQAKEAPEADKSLDYKIYDAVREQAGAKGLRYESGPKL